MSGRHGRRDPSHLPNPAAALAAAFLIAVVVSIVVLKLAHHPTSTASPAANGSQTPREAAAGPASPAATAPATATATPPVRNPFRAAASFLGGRSGTVLAAVYDVRTNRTWTVGTGPPQDTASVVKLDILLTLLAQRAKAGDALSESDSALARNMIEDSDNDDATELWNAVGGSTGVGSFNAAAGLAQTTPSTCLECAGFPWPGWGLTKTVPADQLALLREVVQPSQLLTRGQQSYALDLMENVTPSQRWGISGGVPATATVALKNGWLPLNNAETDWQVNSVGLVSGQGRDYLVAVLTTGNATEQYGIDTISGLSALLWQHLG